MNADIEQEPNGETQQTDSPIVNEPAVISLEINSIESISIEDPASPQSNENGPEIMEAPEHPPEMEGPEI